MEQHDGILILSPDDYTVIDEKDFGPPGLTADESIGPFVDIHACGPLITDH